MVPLALFGFSLFALPFGQALCIRCADLRCYHESQYLMEAERLAKVEVKAASGAYRHRHALRLDNACQVSVLIDHMQARWRGDMLHVPASLHALQPLHHLPRMDQPARIHHMHHQHFICLDPIRGRVSVCKDQSGLPCKQTPYTSLPLRATYKAPSGELSLLKMQVQL